MCKCRPEIRTPYCGRPGCEYPDLEKESSTPDAVSSLAFVTGQMMGALSRHDIQDYLIKKGFEKDKQNILFAWLKDLAAVYYK